MQFRIWRAKYREAVECKVCSKKVSSNVCRVCSVDCRHLIYPINHRLLVVFVVVWKILGLGMG